MKVRFKAADRSDAGEARIDYIARTGHLDSRSVVARAVVDNRDRRWVPGQFVTGEVVIAQARVAVAVTPAALQELRGKTVVFVQNGSGFESRTVQVGRRGRDAVEIVQGLKAGERYAGRNSYLIKADLLKSDSDEG
jgi:cobalt-zinc-cadmium efflux system membrane fusion protein